MKSLKNYKPLKTFKDGAGARALLISIYEENGGKMIFTKYKQDKNYDNEKQTILFLSILLVTTILLMALFVLVTFDFKAGF